MYLIPLPSFESQDPDAPTSVSVHPDGSVESCCNHFSTYVALGKVTGDLTKEQRKMIDSARERIKLDFRESQEEEDAREEAAKKAHEDGVKERFAKHCKEVIEAIESQENPADGSSPSPLPQ